MPAPKPAHRHGDSRQCGASTIVVGQSTVFINNKLASVNQDPNSHGGGNLIAHCNKVYINNKLAVNHTPDKAGGDNADHPAPPTDTAQGSPDVFIGDP